MVKLLVIGPILIAVWKYTSNSIGSDLLDIYRVSTNLLSALFFAMSLNVPS